MMQYASEWAEDPIELEVKLRKAEELGWKRDGLPYRNPYLGTGIPVGWYVQRLSRPGPNGSEKTL